MCEVPQAQTKYKIPKQLDIGKARVQGMIGIFKIITNEAHDIETRRALEKKITLSSIATTLNYKIAISRSTCKKSWCILLWLTGTGADSLSNRCHTTIAHKGLLPLHL